MSTQAQISANQANAKKSTGPRSVEGKAASRLNALKTGIHAESTIVYGEEEAGLTDLAASFYHDHQPETAMECALLDSIIRDTWLLTRFFRIDAEIINYEAENDRHSKPEIEVGKAFIDSSNHQIRLQRRIDATRKSQIQGFKELQRLQAERRAQPPAPQPQPQAQPLDVTAVPSTPKEQIGFVPQTSPEAPEIGPIPVPARPPATGHRHPAPSRMLP